MVIEVVLLITGIGLLATMELVSSLIKIKQEKKNSSTKSHSPTTILVDTIGAIILREADKVEYDMSYGRYYGELQYHNYYFKYDNVKIKIETTNINLRHRDTTSIERFEFSVGNEKDVVLTNAEKEKLLQYLKDAYVIKKAKLDAEKEKRRQLAACDALENLMKPEAPKIPTGGSGVTLGKYSVSGTSSNTPLHYKPWAQ